MKFEHFYNFIDIVVFKNIIFKVNYILKLTNLFLLNYFFTWKIANFADSYWFIYSNKKTIYEIRYFSK